MKSKTDIAEKRLARIINKENDKKELEERRENIIEYYYQKERTVPWLYLLSVILTFGGFIAMFLNEWFFIVVTIGMILLIKSGLNSFEHRNEIAERLGI